MKYLDGKSGAAEVALDDALESLEEEGDRLEPQPAVDSADSLAATLESLEADSGAPGASPQTQAAPTMASITAEIAAEPTGAIGETAPMPELRSGRRALWLVTLIFAAAAIAVGSWLLNLKDEPAPAPPPPPETPVAGQLEVAGAPEGAGVWLHLGDTPARSPPLSARAPHQLRLELDEHAPRDITVLPSRWAERRDEIGVWVSVELEPRAGGPGRGAHRVPDPPEEDSFRATVRGEGAIHIDSDPAGATAWLLVGILPDVQLAQVPADQSYRLKVAKPGYRPQEIEIAPAAFEPGEGGHRARVEVELERAR